MMGEISAYTPKNERNVTDTVESFGGEASFTILEAESPTSEIPILVAGGWSEGTQTLRPAGEQMRASGREVILVDHARTGRAPKQNDDYAAETLHRANTLLAVLDKAGIEKTDIIAHSEGSLDAVFAALRQPERFHTIVIMSPAGMIGKDSILALASRFKQKLDQGKRKDMQENPTTASKIYEGGNKYVLKNPLKAIREVKDMAMITVDSLLADLRKSGIHVGVIQSHQDPVFPDDRIFDHVQVKQSEGNVDAYASAVSGDAGHDDLLIHPERSAVAALQMMEHFERSEELDNLNNGSKYPE